MAKHPPAARRAIIRRLKEGEHPATLAKEARAITDPGHAAAAMLYVATDERMPAAKVAALVRDATDLLGDLDRPGRVAEAWGEVLRVAATLSRGPETENAVAHLRRKAVDTIRNMPNGQWVTDAIVAFAPSMDADGRRILMGRALVNTGGELDAAKALILEDASLADLVRDDAPPEVASRLLSKAEGGASNDALAAAWAIPDLAKRREALRILTNRIDAPHELMAVGGSGKGHDPSDQVAVWTMVGARLDRIGQDASAAFGHAIKVLDTMGGRDALKAHRKLAQAMERSELEAPPAPTRPGTAAGPTSAPAKTIPIKPLARHAFALVDAYSGGLGAPHLRAVARAAPLCIAFDLDLVLMGFPTKSAYELVDLVDAESNVGEGVGYARQLLEAERLHLMDLDHGLPVAWPGTPIATTPHPYEGKATTLDAVDAPICLLIGQGKQGLPKSILDAVPYHHELTGRGISMETATAMGILADRLGRIRVG